MKIATRKEGRIFLPGTNPFRYQVPCPKNHASLLTLEVTVQISKELVPTKCLCQQTAINVQTQCWLLFITQHIFIRMCLKKSTALASACQRRMRKQEMKVGWQQPHHFSSSPRKQHEQNPQSKRVPQVLLCPLHPFGGRLEIVEESFLQWLRP